MPLLEINDIRASYGLIEALHGVSLEVEAGEVVTLIGSNGAGKSTVLRAISGLTPAGSGSIHFDGEEITYLTPMQIVGRGISHVPEGRRCFPRMTVRENLELGAYLRHGDVSDDIDRVFELFPRLAERERQAAGTMSGGEQQMLAIGRAMMARPRLLLMDEPSMGIAPILVERIYETIAEISQSGTTILLVEQNAHYGLGVAARGYVIETGRIVLSGPAELISEDPKVREAYLGA
jgi:branched-chain amino acid transport system ATP-binding protein